MTVFARFFRWLIVIVWMAPVAASPLALVALGEVTFSPEGRCNFGQCWGTGKWDPFFYIILLFPPAWGGVIILHLRGSRKLSWGQYFWSSLVSLLGLQLFNMIWTSFLLNFSIQQAFVVGLSHPITWLMFAVTLQGYIILWYAAHEALHRLPRPLGIAGRDEWDRSASPA